MTFNVVCLKWGDKYEASYVNTLYSMVARHLVLPFTFTCFTDNDAGIRKEVVTRPIPHEGYKGWWNKLSILKAPLEGTTVFLDLDVVITGNIDFLFEERVEEDFLGCKDFLFPEKVWNSSVFRFEPKMYGWVLDRFESDIRDGVLKEDEQGRFVRWDKVFLGDQDWITEQVAPGGKHQKISYSDGKILSYKKDVKGKLPADARIVVFHGEPNPHDLPASWVRNHWK